MAAKVSATKETRNLDDMATCRICLKHFVDPRLLPCSHTYCFGCIRKAASDTNGDFTCPLKDGTTVRRNEISSLQLHPAMVEVVKMVSNVITEDGGHKENSARSDNPQIFKKNMISISGLPFNMSDQLLFNSLWDVFSTVGQIKINRGTNKPSIDILKNNVDRSKLTGSATITFEEEESIVKAIQKYNGERISILNDARIFVRESEMIPSRPLATHLPSALPASQNPESERSTPSKATDIKIWIQLEERQRTKFMVNRAFDIDDLKEVVLRGQGDRDLYQAYYRNKQLKSGELVPSDTDDDQPVIFRKITELHPRKPEVGDPVMPEPKLRPELYTPRDFHIIIDNSNVYVGSQNIYDEKSRANRANPYIRVNVGNLAKTLEENKLQTDIKTRLVGGSTPPRNTRVWTEWNACGYKCVLGDRSAGGKEVFLDNMLHAQIYDTLLNSNDTRNRPQVLVLVTGDGNSNNGQTSFPITVERVLKANWSVELWSWKLSMSRRFLAIQQHFPAQMTIKYLDLYRSNITFEEKSNQN